MNNTKKNNCIYLLTLTAVITFILYPLVPAASIVKAEDRSFHFPSVTIEAKILPCGSMEITEMKTFRSGDYYRELPADYSPAEAGCLMRKGRLYPADFTATLLDLARRGHVSIEDRGTETEWDPPAYSMLNSRSY